MAGFTAQGATFTFSGSKGSPFQGAVVGLNVEAPAAEVVDMTSSSDAAGIRKLVPTGDWTGGQITVDFIATASTPSIEDMVGGVGQLSFASPNLTVIRRAILDSANFEARTGDLVRGTLNFTVTDYQGT